LSSSVKIFRFRSSVSTFYHLTRAIIQDNRLQASKNGQKVAIIFDKRQKDVRTGHFVKENTEAELEQRDSATGNTAAGTVRALRSLTGDFAAQPAAKCALPSK
jgi:pyruvate kinase